MKCLNLGYKVYYQELQSTFHIVFGVQMQWDFKKRQKNKK